MVVVVLWWCFGEAGWKDWEGWQAFERFGGGKNKQWCKREEARQGVRQVDR